MAIGRRLPITAFMSASDQIRGFDEIGEPLDAGAVIGIGRSSSFDGEVFDERVAFMDLERHDAAPRRRRRFRRWLLRSGARRNSNSESPLFRTHNPLPR